MSINTRLIRALVLGTLAVQTLGGCVYVLAFASVIGGAVAVPNFISVKHKAHNARVRANTVILRLGLEQWTMDNGDVYPAAPDLLTALLREGYLPQNRLPDNPFASNKSAMRQTHVIPVAEWPAVLGRAGGKPSPKGTVLGVGHAPTMGAYDALTFGALLYDYDRMRKVYVVYGIGRDGDQAVVVSGD